MNERTTTYWLIYVDGDPRAMVSYLVDRRDRFVAFAQKLLPHFLRRWTSAEDLYQAFVLRLVERSGCARGPSESKWAFRAYAYAALRNMVVDLKKSSRVRRRAVCEVSENARVADDPVVLASANELATARATCLEALPTSLRDVLQLADCGYDPDEICRRLKITRMAMRKRLSRARAALRGELERAGHSDRRGSLRVASTKTRPSATPNLAS